MKQLRTFLRSKPVIFRCLSDQQLKSSISLTISLAGNLLYAIWEMICGIYYRSYWFLTLGCYYVLLMLARLLLLGELRGHTCRKINGWKRYRICGILLLCMNFILSGIVVLALKNGNGSHYGGYLIYAVAAYTFYRVGLAIRNLVKYRGLREPVFLASQRISFASALVSLLSLEIAMLLHFGRNWAFSQTMIVLTGTGVCLILSGVAVHMITTTQKA
ncbi:MAG: hypothetical protein LUC47_08725 [Clostridiales bacterium]|nr:hypothetical protein [Clostridiales bacterium]